jgi:hypothetical protein
MWGCVCACWTGIVRLGLKLDARGLVGWDPGPPPRLTLQASDASVLSMMTGPSDLGLQALAAEPHCTATFYSGPPPPMTAFGLHAWP